MLVVVVLLLVMQLCQLPNGHMARRACIQALNEQPQNASRQVKSEKEEEEGKTGRHCADAMNSWRRGEFFKIATSHRTRARHEQPTLLLLHSSCCCLPLAACCMPRSCLAINALVPVPVPVLLLWLGAASCYCCKLFMHFEVYLKHESKRSALLCSLDAAQLCPGQEFHSMAFQMLFFLASRIAHLFVAVC